MQALETIDLAQHRHFLAIAMEQAEQAALEGTFPIGAVLVGPDGEILAVGRNRVFTAHDPTAHAEVDVIRQAGTLLLQPAYKTRCTLYTSNEPCMMCAGAIMNAGIYRVVWAMTDEHGGAVVQPHAPSPIWHRKYSRLTFLAAPFPEMSQRQRALLAAFDTKRGADAGRWT